MLPIQHPPRIIRNYQQSRIGVRLGVVDRIARHMMSMNQIHTIALILRLSFKANQPTALQCFLPIEEHLDFTLSVQEIGSLLPWTIKAAGDRLITALKMHG